MTQQQKQRPPSNQIYTLESAIVFVQQVANTLADSKKLSKGITGQTADVIIQAIRNKYDLMHHSRGIPPFVIFTREDVRGMAYSLVVGNPYTLATLVRYRCLNDMIYQLQFDRVLNSPFYNYPEVIERDLLIHMDRDIWKNLPYIIAVRNRLSTLETISDWGPGREDDMVCSFVAAAGLYAKILFPGFDSALLSVKRWQISVDPPCLLLPFNTDDERSDASFYRYFLTPPSSNYLMRYLLYMQSEQHFITRKMRKESCVFGEFAANPRKFPSLFKSWTKRIMEKGGIAGCEGLSPRAFREAALYQSVIDAMTGPDECGHYPTFLLSMHCRKVESASFFCKFLPTELKRSFPDPLSIKPDLSEKISQARINASDPKTVDTAIEITRSILYRPLARKLSTGRVPKPSERRETAEEIRRVVADFQCQLPASEMSNIELLTEWYTSMLIHSDTDIKTINNYASDVNGLLSLLPWDRSMIALRREESENAITQVLTMNSGTALKGIRSFYNFIKSSHKELDLPRWGKKEWQLMSERQTSKPFIHYKAVDETLDKCRDFFVSRARRYKDPMKASIALTEAEYKAKIIFHMICFGFFAGLRASEFGYLLIENVIFDGGDTLCVRMSKTKNGWRNIPLSLLAPPWYVEKFRAYYKERKQVAKSFKEPLFPRLDGTFWRSSYLSAYVGKLFASIGILPMRFHILRHSFANWFLLRWFAAFYPGLVLDEAFTRCQAFDENSLKNVRLVILGPYPREGEEFFCHVLAVLARLIGHGGPLTTMKDYLHVGDWLFYLLSKKMNSTEVHITSIQAQDFLQVSYPSLPDLFKGRGKKTVILSVLLRHQIERWLSKSLKPQKR